MRMKKSGLKHFWKGLVPMLVLAVALTANVSPAAFAEAYDVPVTATQNLATNKWDWETDKVGTADTVFSGENGMHMQNFNKGGSSFAVYKGGKLDEFKLSMYANLNLTAPSAMGFPETQYDFDYANVYISFLIDAEINSPAYACPWNGNKAYMSLCFENLRNGTDKNNTIISLYMNEVWASDGATRKVVAENRDVDFLDGSFRWYELKVVNHTDDNNKTGKLITFHVNGAEVISYFYKDGTYKATGNTPNKGKEYQVNVSDKSGFLGFWTNSDFPAGTTEEASDCFVDVKKFKLAEIGSDGTETVLEQLDPPDFKITSKTFSPQASYDAGQEIEIKLTDLFDYEGEEALTYQITSAGESLGTIRNGYWVWTPEKNGEYDVDFKASVGTKSATSYVTFHVTGEQTTKPGDKTDDGERGCGKGSSSAMLIVGMLALGGAAKRLIG